MCFLENAMEYLSKSEWESFQTCGIGVSTPENLLVEITGVQGTKESHLLSQNIF